MNESYMKGDISSFASHMKGLVNNKNGSDIKFMVGPQRKTIYGHKYILSARCEVFKAMFDNLHKRDTKDQDIPFVLADMSPDVFLALMEFIYTNCVTLSTKIAVDVLGTSIEYGMEELRKLCVDFLNENISVPMSCEILQAAVTYGQKSLKKNALLVIGENTEEVLQSKGFTEMSDLSLVAMLQYDELNVDELVLIDAVKEWATINAVVLGQDRPVIAKKVVTHLRLALLSPEELESLEKDNMPELLIPVSHISHAWKCHAKKTGKEDDVLCKPRKGTKPRDHH